MKTHFETDEELVFLDKVLWAAQMTTEIAFEPNYIEMCPEASYLHLQFRKKIYKCIGVEDPNQIHVDRIIKKLEEARD